MQSTLYVQKQKCIYLKEHTTKGGGQEKCGAKFHNLLFDVFAPSALKEDDQRNIIL